MTDLRKDAMALFTPPFKYIHGYIYDSKSNVVADQGGCDEREKTENMMMAQIRGWGRLGYMPNGAKLQDEAGQILVDALNAYFAPKPVISDDIREDAARYRHLVDNYAYHYSMQPDSPAEHGIEFQWQQASYEERNWGLTKIIDVDRARVAAKLAEEVDNE